MAKKQKYSDEYLLSLTKYGPALIGKELYDLVQDAKSRNLADDNGLNRYGPALLGPAVVEAPAK